jgi:hypothetical protein
VDKEQAGFLVHLDNVTFQQRATLNRFTRHCGPPKAANGRLRPRNLISLFGDCFGRFAPSQ